MPMQRRPSFVAIATGVAVLLLAGCAGEPAASEHPWAAEFAEANRTTSSEFVRSVLSDGEITAAEFQEAKERKLDCLTDEGIRATWRTEASGVVRLSIAGEWDRDAELRCHLAWMGPIWHLYEDVLMNPLNEDWYELVAACLTRRGLAPPGFTGEQYLALALLGSIAIEPDDFNELGEFIADPLDWEPVERILPGGADLDGDEAWHCRTAPLQ